MEEQHIKPEETTPQETKPEEAAAPTINIDNLSMRQLMELDACTRCGECSLYCPAYEQDKKEGITPRGRARAFKDIVKAQHGLWAKLFGKPGVSKEQIDTFVSELYECSTCRQCYEVCPVKIDTVELWESIRRAVVNAGCGPLESQKNLIQSVKSYDNPWGQPRSSRSRWAKGAKRQKKIAEEPKDITRQKSDILYFVGCTGSYDVNVEPVAINTTNILQAAGIDFGILGIKEKCCGSVLLRMGDKEYERIAQENIKQFNELGFKTMVTSCAGCFKTFKHDYPKVGKLNFDVKHTLEYIIELIESGQLKLTKPVNLKVTYHDPCHLGRHSGVYDAPRKLLKMIPGIELIEMERHGKNSRCCGAGGGLKSGYPDIQNKISQTRIREAEATGATELVSACPFCYQGLQVGIQALDSKLTMRDITELVVMAIEDKEEPAVQAQTA
ncbi:MAG: Fe-S oxidoreductase [Deltaproteobacteria bacterium]|nr:Fe-S oxidoreductase [Deltaproteobacteria bacterium]